MQIANIKMGVTFFALYKETERERWDGKSLRITCFSQSCVWIGHYCENQTIIASNVVIIDT